MAPELHLEQLFSSGIELPDGEVTGLGIEVDEAEELVAIGWRTVRFERDGGLQRFKVAAGAHGAWITLAPLHGWVGLRSLCHPSF